MRSTASSTLRIGRSGWDVPSSRLIPKKSLHAAEQDREDVRAARANWKQEQPQLDPSKFVFIDETGTSTNMTRLRGRCPRGKRLVAKVPHGHWKMTTFVAGLRQDGITARFVVDAPMNGEIFLTYLEQCLAPTLAPGEIVTMDNLPAHKVAGVRKTIEATGAQLWLPPYPPISIPSNNHSQNSKPICERQVNVQFPRSGIGSEPSCTPSLQRNATTTSNTPVTPKT